MEEESDGCSTIYDFSLLDRLSEEDLSDVEGDALEDYGFNESGKPLESRFENELS